MNYKVSDIVKFKNGEYQIVDIVNNDGNVYLYLINNDEYKNDVSITKVINDNGTYNFTYIDNDDEFNFVLNKLFLNSKDDILDFLVDEE